MSNFKKLLDAANSQPHPQRLLFLLAKSERSNNKKQGIAKGTLTPIMCVDKLPEELTDFNSLVKEADNINKDWNMMLIAGLNGDKGIPPSTLDAEPLLNKMVNDVMQGQSLSRYLILDKQENIIEMVSS